MPRFIFQILSDSLKVTDSQNENEGFIRVNPNSSKFGFNEDEFFFKLADCMGYFPADKTAKLMQREYAEFCKRG